jgi:hypothetical protein
MTCCPLLLRMKQEHLGDAGAFKRGIEALTAETWKRLAWTPPQPTSTCHRIDSCLALPTVRTRPSPPSR